MRHVLSRLATIVPQINRIAYETAAASLCLSLSVSDPSDLHLPSCLHAFYMCIFLPGMSLPSPACLADFYSSFKTLLSGVF